MNKDIFIIGDSITQGFYDSEMGGWVNRLFVDLIQRSTESDYKDYFALYNLGISGNTTKDALKRIRSEITARSQESEALVVLDVGGNDTIRNLVTNQNVTEFSEFSQQYTELIEIAKEFGDVVCLGIHDSNESVLNPIPWLENYADLDEDGEKYDAEIERLAQDMNVTYIPMRGLISKDFEMYSADGDHPTSAGHQKIYEWVKAVLIEKKLL